jgi:hypothetical protein
VGERQQGEWSLTRIPTVLAFLNPTCICSAFTSLLYCSVWAVVSAEFELKLDSQYCGNSRVPPEHHTNTPCRSRCMTVVRACDLEPRRQDDAHLQYHSTMSSTLNFEPDTDIPDLAGKVIFITGGKCHV